MSKLDTCIKNADIGMRLQLLCQCLHNCTMNYIYNLLVEPYSDVTPISMRYVVCRTKLTLV